MNPVARKRVLGGYAFSAEAKAYFNVLTNPPSLQQKIRLDKYLFRPLIANGIFTELDRLWVFASEIQANGLVSLVNPTATAATEVNSPAWVQYQGYTPNGSTSYINLSVAPSAGVNFAQDSASCFFYSRTNNVGAYVDMGSANVALANASLLVARFTGDARSVRLNAATAVILSSNTDSRGLYMGKRTSSNDLEGFKNGVSAGTGTVASTGRSSANWYLGGYSLNGTLTNPSPRQYSIAGIGSGNINALSFYNIIQNYMTQIGSQV